MKKFIVTFAALACASSALGLAFLTAQTELHRKASRASAQIAAIASGQEGRDELARAISREDGAYEALHVVNAVGKGCLWIAVFSSGITVVLAALSRPPHPAKIPDA